MFDDGVGIVPEDIDQIYQSLYNPTPGNMFMHFDCW